MPANQILKRGTAFLLILLWPVFVYAATRTADTSGNWSNSGTWTGGNIPTSSDDVVISNNVDLTVQATDNVTITGLTPGKDGSITIESGGSLTINGNFDADKDFTINVDGDLTINGNLTIAKNLILNVTGTLIINGNVDVAKDGVWDVSSAGDITIDGNLTGAKNTDINVDGTVDITGNINVDQDSDLTGSGSMTVGGGCTGPASFCSSSVLPIILQYFKLSPKVDHILIEWATSSEENFDYFELLKSPDGFEYSSVATIYSDGDSEILKKYDFKDFKSIIGNSYYRLKAVDLDGSFELFPIHRITFSGLFRVSIYPQPAENGFTIQFNSIGQSTRRLSIYDLNGREVFQSELSPDELSHNIPLKLASGLYTIRIFETKKPTHVGQLLYR